MTSGTPPGEGTALYGRKHYNRQCHPLKGVQVKVVDVKRRENVDDLIGRSGVIRHDDTFGHDYLSFDDGGSCDPDDVIVEATPRRIHR